MATTKFSRTPIVGQRVKVRRTGDDWESRSSGIFLGVALDEEDGVPYYYFRDGEINGTKQACFGFPAERSVPTTTDLTPTQLIKANEIVAGRGVDCGWWGMAEVLDVDRNRRGKNPDTGRMISQKPVRVRNLITGEIGWFNFDQIKVAA